MSDDLERGAYALGYHDGRTGNNYSPPFNSQELIEAYMRGYERAIAEKKEAAQND